MAKQATKSATKPVKKPLTPRAVEKRCDHIADQLVARVQAERGHAISDWGGFMFVRLAVELEYGMTCYDLAQRWEAEGRKSNDGHKHLYATEYMTIKEWIRTYHRLKQMTLLSTGQLARLVRQGMTLHGYSRAPYMVYQTHELHFDLYKPGADYRTWIKLAPTLIPVGYMHQMIGTLWRNHYTSGLAEVSHYALKRFFEPKLFTKGDYRGGLGIGLWRDVKDAEGNEHHVYLVENYCRVDHLPYEQQLMFYERAVEWASFRLTSDSNQWERKWAEDDFQRAQAELFAFAQAHGKEVDRDLKNAGVVGQLSLF